MTIPSPDPRTGLPIGREVPVAIARKPGGAILRGRLVSVEPFDFAGFYFA